MDKYVSTCCNSTFYIKMNKTIKIWLSSKEAKKILNLKDCDLMHHRTAGKLKFEKRGNSYFYSKDCIDKLKLDT